MVWGCIQYGGAKEMCKVDGNIDSAKYQHILASQYIPNYKRGQIFQEDGAPCHTSGSTMKFLRGEKIKVLQGWLAQSPDIVSSGLPLVSFSLRLGNYYESNICIFLSRAKRFALQTKIIILRPPKKIAIKYYTIEIKIICIPIKNIYIYFKHYI